jgi:Predicted glycosyltransferases
LQAPKIFKKVGLFNEDFFLTYEETDWCYRAKAIGYSCLVIPEAKLWHKVSAHLAGAVHLLLVTFIVGTNLSGLKKISECPISVYSKKIFTY